MKLKKGDIFEFRPNDNALAYGQIIGLGKGGSISVVLFKSMYKSRPDSKEILEDDILLIANTFDAKLYHKHWTIIDNMDLGQTNVIRPYYKIGTDPVMVENFEGKTLKTATDDEKQSLIYRSYVAPVRLELAFKAYYKNGEWRDAFDDLLYSKAVEGHSIVERSA